VSFQDGAYVETLAPGEYAFWRDVADSKVVEVDMREQTLDVAGQEIMTSDKVTLRLGHSQIGVTLDTYSHVLPSMQLEAATKLDQAMRPSKRKLAAKA